MGSESFSNAGAPKWVWGSRDESGDSGPCSPGAR